VRPRRRRDDGSENDAKLSAERKRDPLRTDPTPKELERKKPARQNRITTVDGKKGSEDRNTVLGTCENLFVSPALTGSECFGFETDQGQTCLRLPSCRQKQGVLSLRKIDESGGFFSEGPGWHEHKPENVETAPRGGGGKRVSPGRSLHPSRRGDGTRPEADQGAANRLDPPALRGVFQGRAQQDPGQDVPKTRASETAETG
jgi:hypothetical protein